MDNQKVLEFINYLADDKTAVDLKSTLARSEERQFVLSGAIEKLDKEKIRAGMTFTITNSKGKEIKSFDERGQEYAIDTFEATKDGRGISKEDQKKTQEAMELVVQFAKDALALKTLDGKPVFDPASPSFIQDVMDEIYTPLVREGILPENFVRDKYSEVYRLLSNTVKNYKGTLEESRTDKLMKDAKIESGLAGSRGKLEKAKAVGAKFSQLKERAINAIGKENVENAMFAKDLASLGYAAYKTEKNLKGWEGGMDSKNIRREDFFLHPEKALALSDKEGEDRYGKDGWKYVKSTIGKKAPTEWDDTTGEKNYGKAGWSAIKKNQAGLLSQDDKEYKDNVGSIETYLGNASDPDYQRGVLENAKNMRKMDKVFSNFTKLTGLNENDPTLKAIKNFLAAPSSDTVATAKFYTMSSIDLVKELTEAGIEIGSLAYEIDKFDDEIKKLLMEESADELSKSAVESIDIAITSEVKKAAGKDAGDAVEGLFESKVKQSSLASALSKNVNGDEFIMQISLALEVMFSTFTPDVAQLGKSLAKSVRSKVKGAKFNESYEQNPNTAIREVVDAVTASVAEAQKDVKKVFSSKETLRQIAAGALYGNEDAESNAVRDLEESEDEMREFENMLVLIDQGGVSAAQQRSIEILIEEMEKDRKVLELVNSVGGALTSMGTGSMGIAGWATAEVTDVIVGEVVGPLKAAKLILEFAVSVKKASERWALWKSFQIDLERSKIAVSSLTSTIQGFYNNKKEQCAFRTVEQALLLIQIAAEIIGSVPTPITLAIGKTMSKLTGLAKQSAKLIEKRYDLKMMKKAWNSTREAIENPGNRKLGLKALKLNPSLGMHAIAWAGTELQPPDPIARMVLDSVGLNEVTLAVSGTEDKVRQYLVTLLNEDRDLTDPTKFKFDANFKTDWAPPLSLDLKCWAVLTNRAARDASPKLELGDQEKMIQANFKSLEKFPAPDTIAEVGVSTDLEPHLDATNHLATALKSYEPMSAGRIPHDEMENESSKLIDLCIQRREKIQTIYFGRQEQEARMIEIVKLTNWLALYEQVEDDDFAKEYDSEEFEFHLNRFQSKCEKTLEYGELKEGVEKANERLIKILQTTK